MNRSLEILLVSLCFFQQFSLLTYGQANLPTSHNGSWDPGNEPAGWIFSNITNTTSYDYDVNGSARFQATNDEVIINFSGNPGNLTYYMTSNDVPGSNRTILVQESDDGICYYTIRTITQSDFSSVGTWVDYSDNLSPTTRYVKFDMTVREGNGLFLDMVTIGAGMTYSNSIVLQNEKSKVFTGTTDREILCIRITTSGSVNPVDVTKFRFTTGGTPGTDDVSDIENAKVWYTGSASIFSTTTQFGSTYITPPDDPANMDISGTQTLSEGNNFFWLTYDITSDATDNNKVDAKCILITVNSSDETPSTTDPGGSRTIAVPDTGLYIDGAVITNGSITSIYLNNMDLFNQTNDTDGSINNDGDIYVEGDWNNNASGGAIFTNLNSSGTVHFTGTSEQAIGGSRATTFENLTINNSSTAGITLDEDITVNEDLTLTNGIVTTNSYKLIITNTTASDLTGYSNASFINGNLRRYISSNTDIYAFPVGDGINSTDYHLAEIINGSMTGVSYLDYYFSELSNHDDNDMNISEEETYYTSVCSDGVWHINPDSDPSGGEYDIKVYFTNFSCPISDNAFAILKRPSDASSASEWTCENCGIGIGLNPDDGDGRKVSDGYSLRKGLTSFSQFGIGRSDAPLPVVLLSFDAKLNGDEVDVFWTTATECNNDYFVVEKTKDMINYKEVVTVDGAGNSNNIINYFEKDHNPFYGLSYYRLKQTNFDGRYWYSDHAAIEFIESFTGSFNVFPNPASVINNIFLNMNGLEPDKEVLVVVKSVLGQVLYSKIIFTDHNGNILEAIDPYNRLSQGIYLVIGSVNNEVYSKKLLIK